MIKKNDFIELEYTGRIKDGNIVFDTTNEKIAKDNSLFNEHIKYGAIIICVGQGLLLKGLEEAIEGKELGKYIIELSPENAFGKKNAKLIQLVPLKKFIEQEINPVPGLQINMDGIIGTIKKSGGGRVIIDFNHPLASREVIYEVELKRIVNDVKEKVQSFLKQLTGQDLKADLTSNKMMITSKKDFAEDIKKDLISKIKEVIGIEIEFITEAEEKNHEKV